MRVAVVGLGDIAQKAYLPVLATDGDVELVLVTRDPGRLAELGDRLRVPRRHRTVEEAVAAGLDAAFVCAATSAHPELVSALLSAGVPVHVDKPLADTYDVAERLVALAAEREVPLATGFNRRWAPAYRELAGWADLDTVVLQKHRVGLPAPVRRVVMDDAIHVVDTLRFLLGSPVGAGLTVDATGDARGLTRVAVQLRAGGCLGTGIMHRASGLTEEVLDVIAPGRRRRVVELADVRDAADGVERRQRRDEWRPVAEQRGFAAMCADFLSRVREGRPVDAGDALETHRVCEDVVQAVLGQLGECPV